ncbi:MAG: DUF4179 domain-containing protein [Lachnospiraceae bacterium]|nr:DUF4179 domain-containing protein [Lachnospiraceae bacterium]
MSERDIIKILQSDIAVPQAVQERADEAFEQIRSKNAGKKRRKAHFSKKKILILAVVAVLALGSITVYAACRNWSKSLSEGMSMTEEQKAQLEEEGAVVFPMQEQAQAQEDTVIMPQSQTCNGVTVTAVQSITDLYAAHLVFKVEGYELPEDTQPDFENLIVTVDGNRDCNWSGSFYDGLVTGADGMSEYADGSPINYEEFCPRYVRDDGSMEYWLTLVHDEKGYFLGKDVHVEFENLGIVEKAEYLSDNEVQGKWNFDWNLQGTDSMYEYTLEESLGDTGAVVMRAEISPITIHVEYQFPYQTRTAQAIDENGNPVTLHKRVIPPPFVGVRLKDGTVYTHLRGGGMEGYLQGTSSGVYEVINVNERIITPDQVAYLLFLKNVDGQYLADEFYEVPVNQ